MNKLPYPVRNYIENNFETPVGLIGCRAANNNFSLDCCEFDLAVFSDNNLGKNKLVNIGKYTIEVITLTFNSRRNIIGLNDMSLVKGFTSTYPLAESQLPSIFNRVNKPDYTRALLYYGKKRILESLFYFDRIDSAFKNNPMLASMWLKLSAFDFLEGVVSLSGQRPMPLHELQQVRITNFEDEIVPNGIQIALNCIGIERANRTTISRSTSALQNLYANEYDKSLVLAKIRSLEEIGMLPDCYYYIGRMAKRQLLKKDEKFYKAYSKLIQIALDLGSDIQLSIKLHGELFNAAKNTLKYYRKINVA